MKTNAKIMVDHYIFERPSLYNLLSKIESYSTTRDAAILLVLIIQKNAQFSFSHKFATRFMLTVVLDMVNSRIKLF